MFLIFAQKQRYNRLAQLKSFQFLKLKKSLLITWASFRNGFISTISVFLIGEELYSVLYLVVASRATTLLGKS